MLKVLSEAVYPSDIKCVVCDGELCEDTRYMLCTACKLTYNTSFCLTCGRPMTEGNQYCFSCYDRKQDFDVARSSFVFLESARELVHRFKYNNGRYLASILAEFMADTFFESKWNADCITFVPIHRKRYRSRGYNQAELLAKELSEKLLLPVLPLLTKQKFTKNMAKLNRAQRAVLIKDSFKLTIDADIRGKKILLVDDVMTTGATANECAAELKKGKCAEIFVLTFASVAIPVQKNKLCDDADKIEADKKALKPELKLIKAVKARQKIQKKNKKD